MRTKLAASVVAAALTLAAVGSMTADRPQLLTTATTTEGAPASTGDSPPATTLTADGDARSAGPPIAGVGDEAIDQGGSPAPPTDPPSSGSGASADTVATAGAPVGAADRSPSAGHPADGAPDLPARQVRDVLPGAGSGPPTAPEEPIGELDDHGPVPAGLGFAAPAHAGAADRPEGPNGLAVAPSCSHQCITRGVAYPRGFGALLVVETSVPARLFVTAVADLDHDGDYEDTHVESTPHAVRSLDWPLDHLQPGETYHVMAAATDEHGHTAYVWGRFTTLSKRDVVVEFGSGTVVGGPGGISSTNWLLGLDGPLTDVTPGQQGILLYQDRPRHVDLEFWVLRSWDDELCEAWSASGVPAHGHDEGACVAWNSTSLDAIDLDRAPAGKTHWTQTSVTMSLRPPAGAGNALPPGYGDPYYFAFEVPVTLHVVYSS